MFVATLALGSSQCRWVAAMLETIVRSSEPQKVCNATKDEPHLKKLQEDGILCNLRREETKEEKDKGATPDPVVDFGKKHAVDVTTSNGKYVYSLKVNGADKELFKTDATKKGLDEAAKELAKLIEKKQKDLETNFKTEFSTDGEDVIKQWVEKPDCSWERGPMVKARGPRLAELYGIEAALNKAQPSHLDQKGTKGLKFYFLTDTYYKNDPALAYFIREDKDKRPAIYFDPNGTANKPITEADAKRSGKNYLNSIEALTQHEIFHNAQYNMGWDTYATKERFAKMIGWLPYEDPTSHETKWIFKGKKDDLYRREQDNCKDPIKWCACHSSGQLVNNKGKDVDKVKDAQQFTRDEITNLALIRPSTWYFVNPVEMFAEGGMKYRLNEETRAELLTESPKLYDAVKIHDQEEIDKYRGVDSQARSNCIRMPDGTIGKNSAENVKTVQDFETKVKAKAAEQEKLKAKQAEKK